MSYNDKHWMLRWDGIPSQKSMPFLLEKKKNINAVGGAKVRGGQGKELEKTWTKKRTNCIPQAAEHVHWEIKSRGTVETGAEKVFLAGSTFKHSQ